MKLLCLGDIVGPKTQDFLRSRLFAIRQSEGVDFIVGNGENATNAHGVNAVDARALLDCGIDLLTMGNHTFDIKSFADYIEGYPSEIVRPCNWPANTPGMGYAIRETGHGRLLAVNVMGQVFMDDDTLSNPFLALENVLQSVSGQYDFVYCDIHAEATSEKLAFLYHFDGRITVMAGTHTHVPTADLRITPKGSGYVTDLGMIGPEPSVLGVAVEPVVDRFFGDRSKPFTLAEGDVCGSCVLFEIDDDTKKVTKAKRIKL